MTGTEDNHAHPGVLSSDGSHVGQRQRQQGGEEMGAAQALHQHLSCNQHHTAVRMPFTAQANKTTLYTASNLSTWHPQMQHAGLPLHNVQAHFISSAKAMIPWVWMLMQNVDEVRIHSRSSHTNHFCILLSNHAHSHVYSIRHFHEHKVCHICIYAKDFSSDWRCKNHHCPITCCNQCSALGKDLITMHRGSPVH